MRLLDAAIASQIKVAEGASDMPSTLQAIERVAKFAPQVLNKEWERVKVGEQSFRNARTLVPSLVFVAAILFFAYLIARAN